MPEERHDFIVPTIYSAFIPDRAGIVPTKQVMAGSDQPGVVESHANFFKNDGQVKL